MSDFIFVIPEGWIRIDWETGPLALIDNPLTTSTIAAYVASPAGYNQLTEHMAPSGVLPANSYIVDARLFNDEIFIVKIAYN